MGSWISPAVASDLAERAPLAVTSPKRAIRATVEHGFDQALSDEVAMTAKRTESAVHKRAVAAVFTRERPRFTGRQ